MSGVRGQSGTAARVLVVYGTRPEAIKMAPVIRALRARDDRFEPIVCTTAQHREMIDQLEELFGLAPDIDLDLMTPDQRLNELTARVVQGMDQVIERVRPDWVLVQGDTTSALGTALAAFHLGVDVGHVEAGLRTGDLRQPFPEEANRHLIDVLAGQLFAPTARARNRLLAEGIDATRIHRTGNTVVDALRTVAESLGDVPDEDEVLVTIHRRESFGDAMLEMFQAVAELARTFPTTRFVLPVHPNPNVRAPAHAVLQDVPNVELCEPLDYPDLVRHEIRSRLVLTDSGGIQEEAPTFGTPVLVLRRTTERPEGVEAGVARLVGTDRSAIVAAASELLTDDEAHRAMATAGNPYGDGRAADRIVSILANEPYEPWEPTP